MINFADYPRGVHSRFTRLGIAAVLATRENRKPPLLKKKYTYTYIYFDMSTRYMKKVYGDVTLEGNDDTSDTEVSVTSNAKSKSFNVFDVVCRTKRCQSYFIPLWMMVTLTISRAHS